MFFYSFFGEFFWEFFYSFFRVFHQGFFYRFLRFSKGFYWSGEGFFKVFFGCGLAGDAQPTAWPASSLASQPTNASRSLPAASPQENQQPSPYGLGTFFYSFFWPWERFFRVFFAPAPCQEGFFNVFRKGFFWVFRSASVSKKTRIKPCEGFFLN